MIPTGFLSRVGLMMGELEGRVTQALRKGMRCCCFCLVKGAECGASAARESSEPWGVLGAVWWNGSADKSH